MKNKELASAFNLVFANASEGIMVCDGFGRITEANSSFERMLGYSAAEMKGKTTQFLHANYENSKNYTDFINSLFKFGTFNGDFLYRRKDGSLLALEGKWSKLERSNETEPYNYLGLFSGSAEHENRAGESLAYNTSYDLLTGLLKLGAFLASLEPVLKKIARDCSVLALISIKINGVIEYKQKHGLKAGDDMVRRIAGALQSSLRESDILAQNTPYSFIMAALDAYNQNSLNIIARKITATLMEIEGFSPALKYAVGVSLYPVSGDSVQALMDRAIFAMNQASSAGPNQVIFADSFENNLFNYPEVK